MTRLKLLAQNIITLESRAGHFYWYFYQLYWVFFNFVNNKKWIVAFFIKLIWLGVGFLNRTGAEIGYNFIKNARKIIFLIGKIKKYRKCPALRLFYLAGWPFSSLDSLCLGIPDEMRDSNSSFVSFSGFLVASWMMMMSSAFTLQYLGLFYIFAMLIINSLIHRVIMF